MERLENNLFLLTSEFARGRAERTMRRHARERGAHVQDVYSEGQRREQGQAPVGELHDEDDQDDAPDPSIRDIKNSQRGGRQTARERVPQRSKAYRDEERRDPRPQSRIILP